MPVPISSTGLQVQDPWAWRQSRRDQKDYFEKDVWYYNKKYYK